MGESTVALYPPTWKKANFCNASQLSFQAKTHYRNCRPHMHIKYRLELGALQEWGAGDVTTAEAHPLHLTTPVWHQKGRVSPKWNDHIFIIKKLKKKKEKSFSILHSYWTEGKIPKTKSLSLDKNTEGREGTLQPQGFRNKHSPLVVPGHSPQIRAAPLPHEGDSKTQNHVHSNTFWRNSLNLYFWN